MPQSEPYLQDKFFTYDSEGRIIDGGIEKAEKVIMDAKGYVSPMGTISYDGFDEDVWDAVKFLCNEWDYGMI